MNIFNVLSQGKSRLHEPSISAMLGYLLSPHGDHGLGDTFLRSFLSISQDSNSEKRVFEDILKRSFINATVDLEVPYYHKEKEKRNDIDIQLSIFDNESKEKHRIIIENKIKAGAAKYNQLSEYYNVAINEDDFTKDKPTLSVIFITPKSSKNSLNTEYMNLQNVISNEHNCCWLYWDDEDGHVSILGLIREILKKEIISEINPINEYMKHTLKAFVRHVSSITTTDSESTRMRRGEDIGDIVDEVEIQTKDGVKHRVIRRDSDQIQVFDIDSGDKEVARRIMAQYIDENGMGIPHSRLNTRMIGRNLFKMLSVK